MRGRSNPSPLLIIMNILHGKKLDDANFLLSRGHATKENAIDYVNWWNNGGKRLTKLELRERISYVCQVPLLTPYLFQYE